jgi:hypothetical protein
MTYSYITFAQAKTQLANRLDASKSFWSEAELGLLLKEALRTWGIASLYWIDTGIFPTVAGQAFYDLGAVLDNTGTKIVARNTTDEDLVAEIQYHLLEPSTGNSWTGSDQFTLDDVTNALERRRNRFLADTGQVITESEISAASPPLPVTNLSDSIIDIRRVAWRAIDEVGNDSLYTHLWRTDETGLFTFGYGSNSPAGVPAAYMTVLQPHVSIRVSPPPSDIGKLHLLSVNTGANLDPTTGVAMGVCDDYARVIKWGALADLLSKEGPANDPARAKYCEGRYRDGVQLAKIAVSVMQAYVNDQQVPISSILDLDAGQSGWQNSSGRPTVAAMAGMNLLALYPVPDSVYSITLEVARNAVLPSADGDFLQVGREYIDPIIDLAQHLAAFKMGGSEFQDTLPLYERFMRGAAEYNGRLRANSESFDVLADREHREDVQRPRVEASA